MNTEQFQTQNYPPWAVGLIVTIEYHRSYYLHIRLNSIEMVAVIMV
jgi:hypothetical protein